MYSLKTVPPATYVLMVRYIVRSLKECTLKLYLENINHAFAYNAIHICVPNSLYISKWRCTFPYMKVNEIDDLSRAETMGFSMLEGVPTLLKNVNFTYSSYF